MAKEILIGASLVIAAGATASGLYYLLQGEDDGKQKKIEKPKQPKSKKKRIEKDDEEKTTIPIVESFAETKQDNKTINNDNIYRFLVSVLKELILNDQLNDERVTACFNVLIQKSTFTQDQELMRTFGIIDLLNKIVASSTRNDILSKCGFILSNLSLNHKNHEKLLQTVQLMMSKTSKAVTFGEDILQILLNISNFMDEELNNKNESYQKAYIDKGKSHSCIDSHF